MSSTTLNAKRITKLTVDAHQIRKRLLAFSAPLFSELDYKCMSIELCQWEHKPARRRMQPFFAAVTLSLSR